MFHANGNPKPNKEFVHYYHASVGKTKEFDLSTIVVSKIGLKVYSSGDWNDQSYHGIRIYSDKDCLVYDKDFSDGERSDF